MTSESCPCPVFAAAAGTYRAPSDGLVHCAAMPAARAQFTVGQFGRAAAAASSAPSSSATLWAIIILAILIGLCCVFFLLYVLCCKKKGQKKYS